MSKTVSMFSKVSTAVLLGTSLLAMSGVSSSAFAQEPKAVKITAPVYPRGAERRNIEGFVIIQYGIQSDGSTSNPTVIEANPPGVFDAAAVQAVQKWKYETTAAGFPSTQKKLKFQLQ